MAMGKRRREGQQALWVPTQSLPTSGGHVFYEKLDRVLRGHDFDGFVESRCAGFYADKVGRPSLAPGVYFRCLLIGYFEGIDSERGIAWRCADSLSLRRFLGVGLDESTPDHSTISRTRRLIDLDTHRAVFTFALKVIAENGLVSGKTIGVDASNMEANAAMRSIVRRDTGEGYAEYLVRLAKASGIAEPTREDLVKIDRNRPKKGSNDDWRHPHDPDAKIAKMKDGRTHMAHKIEHAVDVTPAPGSPGSEGAVIAVTLQPADDGDTTTLMSTLVEATAQLRQLADDEHTATKIDAHWMSEAVLDKGYHSSAVLEDLEEMNVRSYASQPKRSGGNRRRWKGRPESRDAVTPTVAACAAHAAKSCSNGAANSSNAPSPTPSTPAA